VNGVVRLKAPPEVPAKLALNPPSDPTPPPSPELQVSPSAAVATSRSVPSGALQFTVNELERSPCTEPETAPVLKSITSVTVTTQLAESTKEAPPTVTVGSSGSGVGV
jgi:hypothetical protein